MFKARILLFITFVISTKGESLFEPCHTDDIECIRVATETFLSKTCLGSEEMGIKAISPLSMPSLDIITDEVKGMTLKITNATVLGLKNLQVTNFKMDTWQQSATLVMQANLTIHLNLEITAPVSRKKFNDVCSLTISVLETSNYGYTLNDVEGTEYYEVGPETNSCTILSTPIVTVGTKLRNFLDQGADAVVGHLKTGLEIQEFALPNSVIHKIVNSSFETVIQNLRTIATLLPSTAFFIDVY